MCRRRAGTVSWVLSLRHINIFSTVFWQVRLSPGGLLGSFGACWCLSQYFLNKYFKPKTSLWISKIKQSHKKVFGEGLHFSFVSVWTLIYCLGEISVQSAFVVVAAGGGALLTSDLHCVPQSLFLWCFLSLSFPPVRHLTNKPSPSSPQPLFFSLSPVSHVYLEDPLHLTPRYHRWGVVSFDSPVAFFSLYLLFNIFSVFGSLKSLSKLLFFPVMLVVFGGFGWMLLNPAGFGKQGLFATCAFITVGSAGVMFSPDLTFIQFHSYK